MNIIEAVSKSVRAFIRTLKASLNVHRETVRDRAVNSIYFMLKDYSDWYQEAGLALPPDFETDPSGWNEELHKMVRAFKLVYEDAHGYGEFYEAKHKWNTLDEVDMKKIESLTKEVQEGFEAFGKQLQYMTDPEGEYPEAH